MNEEKNVLECFIQLLCLLIGISIISSYDLLASLIGETSVLCIILVICGVSLFTKFLLGGDSNG